MKTIRITILAILLTSVVMLCFGCSRKVTDRSTKTTEISKTDSSGVRENTEKSVEETKTPATNAQINAGNPCDSNGNLKVVYIEVKTGSNTSVLDTRDGTLKTNCYCDSTVARLEKLLHTKDSAYKVTDKNIQRETKYVNVVTNVIPIWCWIAMIGEGLFVVFLAYLFFSTLITKFR